MDNKLYNIHLSRLHHAEVAQLMYRTIDNISSATLTIQDERFTRLLNTLKEQLPSLQQALEPVQASDKTLAIQELDTMRDHDLRALFNSIRPYRFSNIAQEKEAYLALSQLFAQFKNITRHNFEEESSLITNLLTKLNSSEYRPKVTLLGIKKFVTHLSSRQTQFEALFQTRSHEYAHKVTYDVKAIRQQIVHDYRLLCDYVHILAQVEPNSVYSQLLSLLNNARKYYHDTIAKRKGHKTPSTHNPTSKQEDVPPTASTTME